ncbi:c-type heme family protein [Psychroflexus maritimus]|uniref:c-type heme family protein n=1 Tax=Psychroflexus maritimus TaxID=2714865 RepID=UPI001650D57C|nr:DUF3365 domain-containing protein [Psychroflexus maritimus]
MKKAIVLISGILLFFTACKKNKETTYEKNSEEHGLASDELAKKGKKAMENKCYLCHNPTSSEKNRIGPPMPAIKARYLKDASTKEEFMQSIGHFVEKPSKEKAKLKGAIKRFGIMPYQKYSQEEIEAIAHFMYEYKIEEPDWFKKHWQENHGDNYEQTGKKWNEGEQEKDLASIGLNYAKSTKAQLGKNLMGAIQKEGVIHALEFCNVRAMPLTDSMATVHNATIKRVSDKNRNPANKASEKEIEYIQKFSQQIQAGKAPQPIVEENGNKANFYYPIVTNDMCLKCHGDIGKQIQEETYDKILKFYPEDKAIGYDVNQVRGIWSIEFNNKN